MNDWGCNMVKLKIGDKVRHKTCDPHEIGTVSEVKKDDRYVIEWSDVNRSTDHIDSLLRVEEHGSIRTRREIVPGTYGVIRIGKGTNGIILDLWKANPNADELREAAHLFTQIAEVLDES